MFIDYKTTVWERFEIEEKKKDSLLAFLKENPEASAMDIYDWYCENGGDPYVIPIEGTSHQMSPEDNGGSSTLEIVSGFSDDGEILFQNGEW
jgi:hypothetical protein